MLTVSSLVLPLAVTLSQTQLSAAVHLNVTALTYRGSSSILQCWSFEPPFTIPLSGNAPVGAAIASLGTVASNASFIIQAPGSVGGYKNAPSPQYVSLPTFSTHNYYGDQ